MRRCACIHGQARACMRAAACARVRCSVRDVVRARRHTADASRASRHSHLTASPVYESSEGGEESAYDDRMSLERDGSCGACACTPSIRSQLPAQPCVACSPCIRSSHGGGRRWRLPAVHALAPHSVVLADGGAPAVLALGPLSVVLADGGAPAVLALAPLSVVLADGGAPAVLAQGPLSVVLADGGVPQ